MKILKNTISLLGLESISKGTNLSSPFIFHATVEDLKDEIAHQLWLDEMYANCEEHLPYEENFDIDFSLDEEDNFDDLNIPF